MVALEDLESQQMGLVILVYNVESTMVLVFPKNIPTGIKWMKAIPIRINAVHYCFSEPAIKHAMNLTKYMIGTEARLRFRSHFGEFCL
jgi:hypothetical protein